MSLPSHDETMLSKLVIPDGNVVEPFLAKQDLKFFYIERICFEI